MYSAQNEKKTPEIIPSANSFQANEWRSNFSVDFIDADLLIVWSMRREIDVSGKWINDPVTNQ